MGNRQIQSDESHMAGTLDRFTKAVRVDFAPNVAPIEPQGGQGRVVHRRGGRVADRRSQDGTEPRGGGKWTRADGRGRHRFHSACGANRSGASPGVSHRAHGLPGRVDLKGTADCNQFAA